MPTNEEMIAWIDKQCFYGWRDREILTSIRSALQEPRLRAIEDAAQVAESFAKGHNSTGAYAGIVMNIADAIRNLGRPPKTLWRVSWTGEHGSGHEDFDAYQAGLDWMAGTPDPEKRVCSIAAVTV